MMSIYREHLSLIGMLPEDEAASEIEGNETPAAEPEAAPSAAEEPSRPAAESTVPAAAPAASEAPAPIAVPKAPDTVAYEQTVAAFRMNIPILDEEGTEPAAEPAAAVPKPSSRFSDLKFGENYDISQDTDEEPGFFKKKGPNADRIKETHPDARTGLQQNAEPAGHGIPHAGRPAPAGAGDAAGLGREAPV